MILYTLIGYIITILILLFFIILIFNHFFMLVSVSGESMIPSLHEGQICLLKRRPKVFNIGDVYIYNAPYSKEERLVIKRLSKIEGDYLYFIGDNPPKSHDSRHYGYVDKSKVIAKLIYKTN